MRTTFTAAAAAALVFALTGLQGGADPAVLSTVVVDAADAVADNAADAGADASVVATADPAAVAASVAADAGPIAAWKLDEGAGDRALDSSGNGLHGVLTNVNPKWSWIAGKFGAALRFDSFDDSVDVPAHDSLRLKDELTVETWVRFGSFGSGEDVLGNGLYRLYHRGSWAGHRLYFLYRVSEPRLSGDSSWPNWTGVRTETELEPGRWYHVAAVMSGASAAIYLDGVLERELDAFVGHSKDDSEFADLVLGAAPFGGSLDEVAIYDRALRADEIAAHAALGFWRFDETGGDVAHDASPHANDCRLRNMDASASWTSGHDEGAIAFDGVDDFADCGVGGSFEVGRELTVELWAWLDGVADRQVLLGNEQFAVVQHGDAENGSLYFLTAIEEDGPGRDSPWEHWTGVRSTVPVPIGEWFHVLAVKRGDEMELYLNGVSGGSVECLDGLSNATTTDTTLRLGEAPFRGRLDQVMIAGSAMSDTQAERRYRSPTTGAHSNPTGNAVGGGRGYGRLVDPSTAVYQVSDLPGFLHALTQGANGDVVYVADDAEIDLTGQVGLRLRAGVTVASGRGRVDDDGSVAPGALLFTDQHATSPLLHASGDGVRVTGLRIRGPEMEIGDRDYGAVALSRGLTVSNAGFEVDNCELSGWGLAALTLDAGAADAYIHHNRIHHNRRAGYGYGVTLSGAAALIEANEFDYNRHHIIGSGRPGTSLEARHNVLLEHASAYDISMYGARDFEWSISKGNWRFDEGRGRQAEDTSSYADNDCTLSGPTWVDGKTKTALRFDGEDDAVTCGVGERLNLTESLTLEAWVQPRAMPQRAGGAGIVGKNGGATDWADVPYQLAQSRQGALTFSVGDGTSHQGLDIPIPGPGEWYHVAGVFELGHLYGYRDGELVAEARTDVKPHVDELLELQIGRWIDSFDGVIDEVRLHSAALTTDQVRVHMDSPDIAGERIAVHHNTYFASVTPSLVVRGRPAEVASVHDNRFGLRDRAGAVRQYYADENLDVFNNVYGDPSGAEPADRHQLPQAVALAEPHSGVAPLAVAFDGTGSFDPSGAILEHRWSFADGSSAQGAVADGRMARHTFELPGRYDVELSAIGHRGVPARDTVRVVAVPPAGDSALSLWVKDSYRGELSGRYRKQALIGQDVVWEDDVAGDQGWQHVVVDATELLAGQDQVTVTLRVACIESVTEPAEDIRELMVYWDDVALFYGDLWNGDFESAGGWVYSEEPAGSRWSGAIQSGDVRSGGRSFMASYPYQVASEAGSFTQIQQVVRLSATYLPLANVHR